MASFADALGDHGDRPALVTAAGTVTYAELANRVHAAGARLGSRRRLILLATARHPDAVALYLAALAGRHPLILLDSENHEAQRSLTDAYDPDVIARPATDGASWDVLETRAGTRHELHPELALLLSTSGSTASPKLVRLSLSGLDANAEAIASYLNIGPADRAISSLPLAYCYGLSVLNSHLQRGASVVLTDRSVIEPEFWSLFRRSRATSFAGVPYTFDLLDRVGFADMRLPSLRYVTQAGGRLDPARVRAYAELGQARGWELFVMYGQTEATARMTYLPPALAVGRPDSIGVPIPGGSFRIDPVSGAPSDAGELVYRGPNVMLGYADGPSDLALGRTVDELRTGDLGRRGPDGLYEIVGRTGAFLKIAGLRVDLPGVERLVERRGGRACAVGSDDGLVVFAEAGTPADLHALIREAICLPAQAVRVVTLPELPRLANGKVDRRTLQERAAALEPAGPTPATADAVTAVRELYASALGRADIVDEDTFSSLGGDSLSYVEITLGLEEILGHLPDDWATMPIGRLGGLAPATKGPDRWWSSLVRWRSIETGVGLRALAIILIVATHIGMIGIAGGAHVLMAVAGFNFARFRLTDAGRAERARSQLRATARIAIPAMVWVALLLLFTDEYELRHMLLVNALVTDELWGNLWFIELLVYIGLALAAVLAIPAVDRAERRRPFAFALAVLAIGLLFRFGVVDLAIPYTMPVLWLFALGWAASRAELAWQRALVLGVAILSVPGYFESAERNGVILLGVALLLVVPRIRLPAALARVAAVLAGASLYIYLVHWETWPLFEGGYGLPSLGASLAAGIALWLVASHLPDLVARTRGWIGQQRTWVGGLDLRWVSTR
jgi:acyl-CoA synthetase (AMP-forming)/AMP-acid ligase II